MNFSILTGDVVEVLPTLEPNSFDAALTDCPYELGFMQKHWDRAGISFRPEMWAEILRVLKPGGILLTFGGTRTWHRIAVAVEDAGFEIRDTLCWLYGSGFPKSLDISKAIDKAAGAEREMRVNERWAEKYPNGPGGNLSGGDRSAHFSQAKRIVGNPILTSDAVTDLARRWSGYGTALKPAWEPCIVAMKPLDGTFANNAQKWGVAGINVDGGRIAGEKAGGSGLPPLQFGGTNHRPFHDNAEPRAFDRSQGRWPSNVILGHTDRCGTRDTDDCPECGHEWRLHTNTNACCAVVGQGPPTTPPFTPNVERCFCERLPWCAPDCAARQLDQMSGETKSPQTVTRGASRQQAFGMGAQQSVPCFGDSGGASRFFKTISYTESERWNALANSVGESFNIADPLAVSVLSDVVEKTTVDWVLSRASYQAPSTIVTASEFAQICESVIETIRPFDQRSSRGLLLTGIDVTYGPVRCAAKAQPTGTMRITARLWKSDGSVVPVTFDITPPSVDHGEQDSGSSRAFYTSKVSTAEREGSDHPTMKPIDLTRYLAKLILPPARETPRRIVVPFAGVGSEMIGAILAGWDEVVGIEKDEKYAAKARERIIGTAPLFLSDDDETKLSRTAK